MEKGKSLLKAHQEDGGRNEEKEKVMHHCECNIGQIMLCSVFIVIAFLSIVTKTEIDYGVRAMLLAYIAGEVYVKWKYKQSKAYLFLSVAAGFNAILALIEVACSMFGITL